MADLRFDRLAELITHYSTRVRAGEVVFIRGLSPLAEPLIRPLYRAVLEAGALPFPYIHISGEDALAAGATDDLTLLAAPNPMLLHMYETADVVIGIHAAEDTTAFSAYPADQQQARAQARYAPIRIQKRRQAAGTLRRCTTMVPTPASAQAAGMALPQFTEFVFRACKLHLDDPAAAWEALRVRQARLVAYLRGRKRLHVRGPDVDLRMSLEGRTFVNSAGHANLPDGEVFTGPVEQSVEGWARITHPTTHGGVELRDMTLRFEAGEVAEATAVSGEPYLRRMLAASAGARRLGEFGIGTNADITRFTGSTLFDEKMGGTVHIALGQGYPETGSRNESGIHWDLVIDLRTGGEIAADGEVFYQDGMLLVE